MLVLVRCSIAVVCSGREDSIDPRPRALRLRLRLRLCTPRVCVPERVPSDEAVPPASHPPQSLRHRPPSEYRAAPSQSPSRLRRHCAVHAWTSAPLCSALWGDWTTAHALLRRSVTTSLSSNGAGGCDPGRACCRVPGVSGLFRIARLVLHRGVTCAWFHHYCTVRARAVSAAMLGPARRACIRASGAHHCQGPGARGSSAAGSFAT